MTRFGYTLMTEQTGPKELVRYAVSAEHAGFDFEVCSDHFFAVAAARATRPTRGRCSAQSPTPPSESSCTYVTCPTMRYHPAIVAQKAATLQILADGRFTLGLGSGENLNEHVVGQGWPTVQRRHDMLQEAIQIIRDAASPANSSTGRATTFEVDSARLWDIPESRCRSLWRCPASGRSSIRAALRPPDRRRTRQRPRRRLASIRRATGCRRRAGDRPDPDLLGSRPGCRDRSRARPVPLVRRRVGRQRRPADHGGFRGGDPVRPTRGRRRVHPCGPDLDADRRRGRAITGRPDSPTSRWSRSATRHRSPSSRRPPGSLLDKLRTASPGKG